MRQQAKTPTAGEALPFDRDTLVEMRTRARESGDFELADRIRDRLRGLGLIVRDRRDGSTATFRSHGPTDT
jgi:cysteinyl-tRNA synthetase